MGDGHGRGNEDAEQASSAGREFTKHSGSTREDMIPPSIEITPQATDKEPDVGTDTEQFTKGSPMSPDRMNTGEQKEQIFVEKAMSLENSEDTENKQEKQDGDESAKNPDSTEDSCEAKTACTEKAADNVKDREGSESDKGTSPDGSNGSKGSSPDEDSQYAESVYEATHDVEYNRDGKDDTSGNLGGQEREAAHQEGQLKESNNTMDVKEASEVTPSFTPENTATVSGDVQEAGDLDCHETGHKPMTNSDEGPHGDEELGNADKNDAGNSDAVTAEVMNGTEDDKKVTYDADDKPTSTDADRHQETAKEVTDVDVHKTETETLSENLLNRHAVEAENSTQPTSDDETLVIEHVDAPIEVNDKTENVQAKESTNATLFSNLGTDLTNTEITNMMEVSDVKELQSINEATEDGKDMTTSEEGNKTDNTTLNATTHGGADEGIDAVVRDKAEVVDSMGLAHDHRFLDSDQNVAPVNVPDKTGVLDVNEPTGTYEPIQDSTDMKVVEINDGTEAMDVKESTNICQTSEKASDEVSNITEAKDVREAVNDDKSLQKSHDILDTDKTASLVVCEIRIDKAVDEPKDTAAVEIIDAVKIRDDKESPDNNKAVESVGDLDNHVNFETSVVTGDGAESKATGSEEAHVGESGSNGDKASPKETYQPLMDLQKEQDTLLPFSENKETPTVSEGMPSELAGFGDIIREEQTQVSYSTEGLNTDHLSNLKPVLPLVPDGEPRYDSNQETKESSAGGALYETENMVTIPQDMTPAITEGSGGDMVMIPQSSGENSTEGNSPRSAAFLSESPGISASAITSPSSAPHPLDQTSPRGVKKTEGDSKPIMTLSQREMEELDGQHTHPGLCSQRQDQGDARVLVEGV